VMPVLVGKVAAVAAVMVVVVVVEKPEHLMVRGIPPSVVAGRSCPCPRT
jgi:hypothetical protein